MIEEVHPPHQVMVLGEAGTVYITASVELHLVIPIQLLRA